MKTRSGSGNGRLRSRTPLTRLNIAALAPMPSASVSTATVVKPGALRRTRRPYRRSESMDNSQLPTPKAQSPEPDYRLREVCAEVSRCGAGLQPCEPDRLPAMYESPIVQISLDLTSMDEAIH